MKAFFSENRLIWPHVNEFVLTVTLRHLVIFNLYLIPVVLNIEEGKGMG